MGVFETLLIISLVPRGGGGLVCEEIGLIAFLSNRPSKGVKNIDDELHRIMIKSRAHYMHTGHGIERTLHRV